MNLEGQDKIKKLILLYITGEIPDQELKELNDWRSKDIRNEKIFLRMTSPEYLDRSIKKFLKNEEFEEQEWLKIRNRTVGRKRHPAIYQLLKYAAALIIPVIVGGTLYYYFSRNTPDSNFGQREELSTITHQGSKAILVLSDGSALKLDQKRYIDEKILERNNVISVGDTIKYGKKVNKGDSAEINTLIIKRANDFNIILSDGTSVYLNSESELTYPVCFGEKARKVSVKGQAYFVVTKDEKRPFIVDVNGIQIKVLGTSFCVSAFEDEEDIVTTLVEGRVKIISGTNSYNLVPGQQAILNIKSEDIVIRDVNVEFYTSWKDGRIVFDKTPLKDIMRYLSRIYSVDVVFENKTNELLPFSMNITKYNNFLEIVELIEKTNKVQFDLINEGEEKVLIVK